MLTSRFVNKKIIKFGNSRGISLPSENFNNGQIDPAQKYSGILIPHFVFRNISKEDKKHLMEIVKEHIEIIIGLENRKGKQT